MGLRSRDLSPPCFVPSVLPAWPALACPQGWFVCLEAGWSFLGPQAPGEMHTDPKSRGWGRQAMGARGAIAKLCSVWRNVSPGFRQNTLMTDMSNLLLCSLASASPPQGLSQPESGFEPAALG